ncbi:hypothetical protein [Xanthobacter sediminis]|uniref:hypothetical protein n=1 Tax=Xanthobacter sediminis TaxID=3119926 RepID=UPI00372806C2
MMALRDDWVMRRLPAEGDEIAARPETTEPPLGRTLCAKAWGAATARAEPDSSARVRRRITRAGLGAKTVVPAISSLVPLRPRAAGRDAGVSSGR